ncbi:MAG: hypothetical protein KBG83_00095 [Bacteroidetes bacterium]|nr:hypothetical protein [Bacteroidota bacterium]
MSESDTIIKNAEMLVRLSRSQIFRWLRDGKTLQWIEANLAQLIQPNQLSKLQKALEITAEQMAKAQGWLAEDAGPSAVKAEAPELLSSAEMTLVKTKQTTLNFFRKEVRRAIAAGLGANVLQKRLEEQSESLHEQLATLANTQVAAYNNLLTFKQAEESGTEQFLYSGPLSPSTRPFCRAHVGRIFTKEQILKMDNGQGLPVLETCGGYNCRHSWVAVPNTMSEKDAGGVSASNAQPVKIGRQTFVMDDRAKQILFAQHRMLYVEATKPAQYESAKALAHAHDGLNETITNTPNEGIWALRFKKQFLEHFEKRKKEKSVETEDEYKRLMHGNLNNPNAEVYKTRSDDGSLRYIIFNSENKWLVMTDESGKIVTSYRQTIETPTWKRKILLGKLKDFIGEF